jgi:hypothetical protein
MDRGQLNKQKEDANDVLWSTSRERRKDRPVGSPENVGQVDLGF